MALIGQLVLLVAGDGPLAGGNLTVPPHGQPRSGFAVLRNFRFQMARTKTTEHFQAFSGCLGPIQIQKNFTQTLAYPNRRIRGGISAASDAALDLP